MNTGPRNGGVIGFGREADMNNVGKVVRTPLERAGALESAAALLGIASTAAAIVVATLGTWSSVRVAGEMALVGLAIMAFAIVLGRLQFKRYVSRQAAFLEAERSQFDQTKRKLAQQVRGALEAPATTITQLATALDDAWQDLHADERRDLITRIVQTSGELGEIANGLGCFEGTWEQRLETVDLAKETAAAVEALGNRLHGNALTIHISPGTTVLADSASLRCILRHLLLNAVNFSDPGSMIILRSHAAGNNVVVSVDDIGPGVPEAEQAAIFDLFHRIDPRGKAGGLGIGLAVARHLAELQGGRIWIDSAGDRGSTFSFTLRRPGDRNRNIRRADLSI